MQFITIESALDKCIGYHVSPGKNYESILKKGLLVKAEKLYTDDKSQATVGGIYFNLNVNELVWAIRNIKHNMPSTKSFVLISAFLNKKDIYIDEDEFIDFFIPRKEYNEDKLHSVDFMYPLVVKHNSLWKYIEVDLAKTLIQNYIDNKPRHEYKDLILKAMKQITSSYTFQGNNSVMTLTDVKYKTPSHIRSIHRVAKDTVTLSYGKANKILEGYLPKLQREIQSW